jgi:hypothetical protein
MTAKEKAKQLMNDLGNCTRSNSDTKIAAIILCNECLNTKNYPHTLHPEMTDFSNAYWRDVIEEIHKLKSTKPEGQ